ncbi:MAG: biotin--[acetyl-CoA-carboxylase] ligase [Burkholderiales bacterium]|nr:biotin--[acetyl-CoA-carboxylase] ligase [Burkholderiales bacterium]
MYQTVEYLKLIDNKSTLATLAKKLNLTWLSTLELIGKINNIEAGLVKIQADGKIVVTRKLDWLNEAVILQQFHKLGVDNYGVKLLAEVTSTNSYILDNLSILKNHTVVVAELQSCGQGRGDKLWTSILATDLTISFLYFFEPDFNYELLPLVIAIAINRLLKQYRTKNYIKWPNDIYLDNNTKISGILLQSGIFKEKRFIIIGIGLDNIFNFDRNILVANLVNHVEHIIGEYTIFGFALLRQEWIDNCLHYNKRVSLTLNGKIVDFGINTGLTSDGQLVIQSKNGQQNQYENGNLSLLVENV